jgi:hypothetical protein
VREIDKKQGGMQIKRIGGGGEGGGKSLLWAPLPGCYRQ